MCIFLYKPSIDQEISCSALSPRRGTKTVPPAKSLLPPRQSPTEQPQVPASSLSNRKTGRATITAFSRKTTMSHTPSSAISAPPPSYASQKSWSSRLSFRRKSRFNGAPSGLANDPSITPSESRSSDPFAPSIRTRFRGFCKETFRFFPRKQVYRGSVEQCPPVDTVSCDPHRVYRTKSGASRKEHDYRIGKGRTDAIERGNLKDWEIRVANEERKFQEVLQHRGEKRRASDSGPPTQPNKHSSAK